MNAPRISVVIRTFNRSKMLRRALESVENQTFREFEAVILDDWSSDDTEAVCSEICVRDGRFSYFRPEEHLGFGGRTLNAGVGLSKGDWIALLDDDDWWKPNKLELQLAAAEALDGNGLVTCWQQNYDLDHHVFLQTIKRTWSGAVYEEAIGPSGHIFGPPSAVIFDRKLLELVGEFDGAMPRGACQDFFRRASKYTRLVTVEEPLLVYGVQRESITSFNSEADFVNDVLSRRIRLEKSFSELAQFPDKCRVELQLLWKSCVRAGDHSTLVWAHHLASEENVPRMSRWMRVFAKSLTLFCVANFFFRAKFLLFPTRRK